MRHYGNKTISYRESFLSKFPKCNDDACWEWQTYRDKDGYGKFRGKMAHRVSWEMHAGDIPAGLFVLHHCDNPPCVNPAHLFLGTHLDNMGDMVAKGRKSPISPKFRHSRLTAAAVREMRRLKDEGFSSTEIAERFSVARSTAWYVIAGRTWANV